ncbi:unnamed protein product [Closterium sp. NIES-54]
MHVISARFTNMYLFTACDIAYVVVAVHPDGWMDTDGVMHWLDECIKPFTRPRFRRQARSAMVVLDSYRGHLTDAVKEKFADLDIVTAVIPSGCLPPELPKQLALHLPDLEAACRTTLVAAVLQLQPFEEEVPQTLHWRHAQVVLVA